MPIKSFHSDLAISLFIFDILGISARFHQILYTGTFV